MEVTDKAAAECEKETLQILKDLEELRLDGTGGEFSDLNSQVSCCMLTAAVCCQLPRTDEYGQPPPRAQPLELLTPLPSPPRRSRGS